LPNPLDISRSDSFDMSSSMSSSSSKLGTYFEYLYFKLIPDQYHFPTSVASRQVSLPGKHQL
jgi:hypothetical protein